VEAGSQGIPLLLSDIAVFREIAGDDATYFPVGDAKRLAALTEELIQSKDSHRPKAIKAMTWSESAARLATILLLAGGGDYGASDDRNSRAMQNETVGPTHTAAHLRAKIHHS
jgi:hypothetical protein